MTSAEVYEVQLSKAEKDALVRRLDEAAALLGTEKPPKLVFQNANGTWDVGCTLEGDENLLAEARTLIFLALDQP